ncbi:MAG TPA: ABC transporter substrate-binding protein [Thermoleophilia bacterium]|nr:ABC transporter substrate-binding protein [Thermoleophilia bacterium]
MSRRNQRWVGLVALVAILIVAGLVIAACGSSSSSSSSSPSSGGTPKAGGTYNFPLGAEPISIEPLNTQESEGANVEHQIFQGLEILKLMPDGTTEAVPDLADGPPQVNSNATVFTFKIKQGVMFGPPVSREVTAQDFVDSFNYVAQAKNQSATVYILAPVKGIDAASGYAGKNGLTGVKALDKYTLQITLSYPFADFPATLVHPITHVFPVDYANKIGRKAFFDKPVGTGPYMVQSWIHNQSVTLVKNPSYWNTSGSGDSAKPGNVDTINMPIYTDNSTEWLAFQKGTLDYSSVPAGNVHAAENNANVKSGAWTAKAYASTAVYFISVAMNHPVLGGANQGPNLPIRAALNYAADRTAVCNIVNEGVTIPSDEIVPVTIPGYKPGLNPYPYDPAKAQPELDKFTGTLPTNIPYWYNTGSAHDKIAQVLIAGWTKAMPKLSFKLNGIETNSYWTQCGQGKAPALFRMGWIADYPSIDNFIYLFTTQGGLYGSYSRYSNPEVDKLFKQARSTLDQTQRFALYNQAQSLILADAPCIPVYTYRDFRVTNNKIGGFSYNSFGLINMWDVWVK